MKRIEIIDSLRGFTLLLILLYHSYYNFGAIYSGENTTLASVSFDPIVTGFIFHFVAERAFGIFSILFGLSFYIQFKRGIEKNENFSALFIRRLIVLIIIGYIHSLAYRGDILTKYAVLGFLLLPLNKLNNTSLAIISFLLLIQIPDIYRIVQASGDQSAYLTNGHESAWSRIISVSRDGTLPEVLKTNMWLSNREVWIANIYSGRINFILGFFIAGLIMGRKLLFKNPEIKQLNIIIALIAGSIFYIALWFLRSNLSPDLLESTYSNELTYNLLDKYMSICMILVILTAFVLIYRLSFFKKILNRLIPYGRMGLTSYITQAFIGVPLFYGFGLALHNISTPLFSMLIGTAIFSLQIVFSNYWFKHHLYGPAEWFWRYLTNYNLKKSKSRA